MWNEWFEWSEWHEWSEWSVEYEMLVQLVVLLA
jgi:hypothetical protein